MGELKQISGVGGRAWSGSSTLALSAENRVRTSYQHRRIVLLVSLDSPPAPPGELFSDPEIGPNRTLFLPTFFQGHPRTTGDIRYNLADTCQTAKAVFRHEIMESDTDTRI